MEIIYLEEAVAEGFNKTFIFKWIVELEKEFFPKYPYNIKDIKKFHELSNGYSLILIYKDDIIGYLIPILFKNKDYLQILTIAVDKKHQKKGYGTKLINRCEDIAKSLKLKVVIIRADVSYPIVRILKKLKYNPMQLRDINKFTKEGIFSSKDIIKNKISDIKISSLFPKAFLIAKYIGKKNPYSFIPMIKKLS